MARVEHPRPLATGFTLLEVVVAAGLLLMTVAAVTGCVTAVSRGGTRLQASMDADRAVRTVADRLRGLPFCATAYPDPGAPRGLAAADLVAAVYPHATASENTETARYDAVGDEDVAAGSFVTLMDDGGVQVRCVARFLSRMDGVALGPAELDGWSADLDSSPPGAALVVILTAGNRRVTRTVSVAREALSAPPIVQPLSVSGASP
jgi:type II secretory pathway pseudopilin PulG